MRLVPVRDPEPDRHRAAREPLGDHDVLAGPRPRDRRRRAAARRRRSPPSSTASTRPSAATSSPSRTRSSTSTRTRSRWSTSARSRRTRAPSPRRCASRCARTRTSSSSARCATSRRSRSRSRPPRRATSCSRRSTRRRASSTVDRIINAFPPDQQGQIRMMVADSLKAVISQSLLPRRDGNGPRRGLRDPAQHAQRRGPDPRRQDVPDPDGDPDRQRVGHDARWTARCCSSCRTASIEPRVAYDRAQRKEAFEPFLAAEEGGAA